MNAMKRFSLLFSVLLLTSTTTFGARAQDESPSTPEAAPEAVAEAPAANPHVVIETSLGTIVAELYADKAPATVENFLAYAETGYYDGTIFHRVISRFMIQGGGFDTEMVKKPTRAPIQNEADNGLKNLRGTLAMARTFDPHSATSQFFINQVDNVSLDHKAKNGRDWGYAVFGNVVEGMDVVDAIASVKTGNLRRMPNAPLEMVSLVKMTVRGDS